MKRKKLSRKLICALAALSMISTQIAASLSPTVIQAQTASRKQTNIALGKPVFVSGIEGGTKEDGTLTYPQFDSVNLTDGNHSTRWSSNTALTALNLEDNPDQNVWCIVDLEEEVELGSISLYWQSANSRNYDIQVSTDNESWTVLQHYEDPNNNGTEHVTQLDLEAPVAARYIRVYARLGTIVESAGNYKCPSISLYEIEAKRFGESEFDLEDVLNQALTMEPSISEDGTSLVLPQLNLEGYTLSLGASSNEAVIAKDGSITAPLQDMKVNLFYEVSDGQESLLGDEPKTVIVPGAYQKDEQKNEKPAVVPEIREWKGDEGLFTYSGRIVVQSGSEDIYEAAEHLSMSLEEMCGLKSAIVNGQPQSGDIVLLQDEQSVVGDEGYEMEISDVLTLWAPKQKGLIYGSATISQMMTLSADGQSAPCGLMRDYPQYQVRSAMLDVARQYIPLDYLEEITKFAGYYKLSEFRNHINDNGGEQGSAFRVESKKYPELNTGITAYGQEEYKQYQKNVKEFGIDVVTEIDTPAHAGCFAYIDSSLLMDGYHLDLRTEEKYQAAISIVKDVFDEMLDGDDPVFQNGKFHIGTDEYDRTYSETLRRYINELIEYVNEKGIQTRFWASLGTGGFAGETPVSNEVIAHMWSHSWASFTEMKEQGYSFINNVDGILYSVPWAGYYHDTLDIASLYETWEYSNLGGGYTLAAGHPQLLGAESALWYDMKVGASEFDIFYRLKDQIRLMAEKGWYGEDDQGSGDAFVLRCTNLGDKAPQSNASRTVESAGELTASYDPSKAEGSVLKDLSENGYDAALNNLSIRSGGIRLNGSGYVSLPFDSIGYPYTITMDLEIDDATGENALIFEGKDGKFFFNYDGTGKLGFERKGYSYVFDYVWNPGERHTMSLVGDETNTTLYIDEMNLGHADYYKVTGASKQASTTFVLPTEKIGSGLYGWIRSISIWNTDEVEAVISSINPQNLALHQSVTVSGVEGGYKDDGTLTYPQFDPANAVDGSSSTRISLEQANNAWLSIDLGQQVTVSEFIVHFNEQPAAWDLQVSDDGQTWTTLESYTDLQTQAKADVSYKPDGILKTRYVRYQQRQGFTAYNALYSGNFSEFEVLGYPSSYLQETYESLSGRTEQISYSVDEKTLAALSEDLDLIESLITQGPVYTAGRIMRRLDMRLAAVENGEGFEVCDVSRLKELLEEDLDEDLYDAQTWSRYEQAVLYGESILYDRLSSQKQVDGAVNTIEMAKNNLGVKAPLTVTTNKTEYLDYTLDHLTDGDEDTICWLSSNQKADDYILFTFGKTQEISSVQLNQRGSGGDILQKGCIEVSMDGTAWTKAADVSGVEVEDIEFETVSAKYLRLRVTEDGSTWWKIREITINHQLMQDKTQLSAEYARTLDQADYTDESWNAYQQAREAARLVLEDNQAMPKAINDAYAALRDARLALIKVLRTELLESLCDPKNQPDLSAVSKESAEVYRGVLEEAKALLEAIANEEEVSQLEVNRACWNLQEAAALLENLPVQADKTLLSMAVSYAQSLVDQNALEHLNPLAASLFNTSLANAQKLLEDSSASQQQVNDAWIRLCRSIQMIGFTSDKTQLKALIAQAQAIDTDKYDQGVEEFSEALAYAVSVDEDEAALDDISIAAAVERLTQAIAGLSRSEEIDTSLLVWLVDYVKDTDLSLYIANGQEEFSQALVQAFSVLENPESQSQVDQAASMLADAWLNLRLRPSESLLAQLREFITLVESMDLSVYSQDIGQKALDVKKQIELDLANQNLDEETAKADMLKAAEVLSLLENADIQSLNSASNQSIKSSQAQSVSTASAVNAAGYMTAGLAALGSMLAAYRKKQSRK